MEKIKRFMKKIWSYIKKHKIKFSLLAIFITAFCVKKAMERFIYTSKFLKAVERGQIERVMIYGIFLGYRLKGNSSRFFTHRSMLTDENLLSLFKQYNVKFTTFPVEDKTVATILFGVVLPMVVWIYVMKNLINPSGKKQQYFNRDDNNVLFKDIGGNEDAKASLQEIIDYIRNPEIYIERGIRLPRGVLLYGPPGTGKTLIAKAVANECNIHFIYTCGSDFVEIFVGQGPKRIRELFREARQNDKCIIIQKPIYLLT